MIMENSCEKPNIKLSKLVYSDNASKYILTLYKALRGKENLEERLFLKTLVYCCIQAQYRNDRDRWLSPREFFTEGSIGCFNDLYRRFKENKKLKAFGVNIKDMYGYML